ncbi:hypothetical protein PsorP6_014917 [Peronosclerospora sorghi]|uniref:Uncharacterized protein n=1 Tax=Peronosclerospora sorghi TaxID=230839 RepID=A0ACC0VUZ9_9STRA|nr:hypothetical protein PsorP6_014917 [Peronosclerospora sorghi]
MANLISVFSLSLLAVASVASGGLLRSEVAPMPNGSWPVCNGKVFYKAPYRVKTGTTFDGGMKTYARSNIKCQGQKESGWQTSVFLVEPGATLRNVIIGTDQMEGVHCEQSDCIIQNVWWDNVCEDALTIKGGSARSVTSVIGGGARFAEDKVIQHNGLGAVSIEGFYVQDFGKLYRSCGTCGGQGRKVSVKNVYAVDGKCSLVTVNKNLNDQAKIENIKIKGKRVNVCAWTESVTSGEPKIVGDGVLGKLCRYSPATVTYV